MKKIILLITVFILNISVVSATNVKYAGCVDGDTIKVYRGNEKITVRLLAIDTPEIAKEDKKADYYGDEASEYTCNRIQNAKKISLEYDKNSDKEDKYGRVLAWVFVDNNLLQDELVEKGYAKVAYLYDEYKYADSLKAKQEIASSKEIGIWNTKEKEKYDNNDFTKEDSATYENFEIIILIAVFLGIVFLSKIFKK